MTAHPAWNKNPDFPTASLMPMMSLTLYWLAYPSTARPRLLEPLLHNLILANHFDVLFPHRPTFQLFRRSRPPHGFSLVTRFARSETQDGLLYVRHSKNRVHDGSQMTMRIVPIFLSSGLSGGFLRLSLVHAAFYSSLKVVVCCGGRRRMRTSVRSTGLIAGLNDVYMQRGSALQMNILHFPL